MQSNKKIFYLVIYIFILTFFVFLIGNIFNYYYKNIKNVAENSYAITNFTNFDLYMLKNVKYNNTSIKAVGLVNEDEKSYFITFENDDGTKNSFSKIGKILYYNQIKICEDVDEFRIFVDKSEKISLNVELIISGELRNFQYSIN